MQVTLSYSSALPKADPQPPTPDQAAKIATTAWADPDWGMLVWLAMTRTGAVPGLVGDGRAASAHPDEVVLSVGDLECDEPIAPLVQGTDWATVRSTVGEIR